MDESSKIERAIQAESNALYAQHFLRHFGEDAQ